MIGDAARGGGGRPDAAPDHGCSLFPCSNGTMRRIRKPAAAQGEQADTDFPSLPTAAINAPDYPIG